MVQKAEFVLFLLALMPEACGTTKLDKDLWLDVLRPGLKKLHAVLNRVGKSEISVLNVVGKSDISVLNRVRVWAPQPHLPAQTSVDYPPPPRPGSQGPKSATCPTSWRDYSPGHLYFIKWCLSPRAHCSCGTSLGQIGMSATSPFLLCSTRLIDNFSDCEILKCDHSNESYWAVLSCSTV